MFISCFFGMKKYVILFIVCLLFLWVSFAQQTIDVPWAWSNWNTNNWSSPQPPNQPTQYQTDPNQTVDMPTAPDIVPSNTSIADQPWYWYCYSLFSPSFENLQTCLGCIQNWALPDVNAAWVIVSCTMMQQLCTNAYSVPDDQAKCNNNYNSCISSWWSPDRCSCKALWWISLNTNVPFVGNCISLRSSSSSSTTEVTPATAFPRLLAWLTKIVMTVILIFCFMAIIVGGVLISMGWASEEQATTWKKLIKHVVVALALLGASGVILRVINPSFFS